MKKDLWENLGYIKAKGKRGGQEEGGRAERSREGGGEGEGVLGASSSSRIWIPDEKELEGNRLKVSEGGQEEGGGSQQQLAAAAEGQ